MIGRRDFIAGLGSAAALPVLARAQNKPLPVIGFVNAGSADADPSARTVTAFRKGLSETGYVEGQNVTVEYHWLEGQYDRLPALMADLVRRRVAVIATPSNTAASIAAKAATATISIVFGVAVDPVKLGLVASLARPGGNATGVNWFTWEVIAKRLSLLHELVPKAVRVAVLVNSANVPAAETALRDVQNAAHAVGPVGLQIYPLNATTIGEIDAAFGVLARERPDALFVAPDSFFASRRVQIVTLAARERIPAAYPNRGFVASGGLMSYGTDVAGRFRQTGIYTGKILNGAKPADLPVVQPTKFEFVINLKTAKALGLTIPETCWPPPTRLSSRRAEKSETWKRPSSARPPRQGNSRCRCDRSMRRPRSVTERRPLNSWMDPALGKEEEQIIFNGNPPYHHHPPDRTLV
jgi:putative tryptophan/tyrosine transport system substrate-binding protein